MSETNERERLRYLQLKAKAAAATQAPSVEEEPQGDKVAPGGLSSLITGKQPEQPGLMDRAGNWIAEKTGIGVPGTVGDYATGGPLWRTFDANVKQPVAETFDRFVTTPIASGVAAGAGAVDRAVFGDNLPPEAEAEVQRRLTESIKPAVNPANFIPFSGPSAGAAALKTGLAISATDPDVSPGVAGVGALALHGAGRALAPVASKAGDWLNTVRNYVQGKATDASDDIARIAAQRKESAQASARGTVGSVSADTMKTYDRLVEATQDMSLPQAVRETAEAQLQLPEMIAARANAVQNYAAKAPQQVGRLGKAQSALDEANAIDEVALAQQVAKERGRSAVNSVKTLGFRQAPVLMTSIGAAVGGTEGAIAGSVLGGIMSATQGNYGRLVRNLQANPRARQVFWNSVTSALGGGPEKYQGPIRALEAAAAQGEQKFAVAAYVLSQQNPDARALLQKVAEFDERQQSVDPEMAEAPY